MTANGPDLYGRVGAFVTRYVAFPSVEAAVAVVLWIFHCHVVDAFDSTPRLAVLSPEKGSGKTRVLEVAEVLVPNPVRTVNISSAAMFRIVSDGPPPPVLLLDEADTYLGHAVAKQHEDLRGLINAGHRRGAVAYRAEVSGKTIGTVKFPAFAPCALAGIGDLPDTILDRSVVIAMKRRAPGETVEPFRERRARAEALPLFEELCAWGDAHRESLTESWPEMPDGVTDRAADVWEPLIAIADVLGCGDVGRASAVALNDARQARDPSFGVQLLADCKRIYADRGVDRLPTEDLVNGLVGLDEAPWGDLRGKPLDARGLARRLGRFDVKPADHRFENGTKKGYRVEDFHDAWTRYLPDVADVALVAHSQPEKEAERTGAEVLPLFDDGVGDDLHNVHGDAVASSTVEGQQGQQRQHHDEESAA